MGLRVRVKQGSKPEPYETEYSDEVLRDNFTEEQIAALRRGEPVFIPCFVCESEGSWVYPL